MKRPPLELDIENLLDFFQIKCKDRATGVIYNFPLYPGCDKLDLPTLVDLLARYTIYTFNGINYDLPILVLALYGATQAQLKQANDMIIVQQQKWWDVLRHFGCEIPEYIDHVDLIEVSPGVAIGLKMYMGRIHAPTMQDIPVPFDSPISPPQRLAVSFYCDNDLEGTGLLREELAGRLALREAITAQYGVDVRSKSDAQIAESVIKSQLSFTPNRRYIPHGYSFNYEPPAYIRFVTPQLQELLRIAGEAKFVVNDREEAIALGYSTAKAMGDMEWEPPKIRTGVKIPRELAGMDIRIGQGVYRIGIGGLHSQESSVNYMTIPGVHEVKDVDVRSYYPSLILTLGMCPEQLGPGFQTIYRKVFDRRLAAKDAGEMTESDGLKIVLNGTFGKLFSKYSILFAPELGIRVTLTGQLDLLMLIEMMELSGIRVLSANTDGIVLLIPEGFDSIARSIVQWWERITSLQMEYTPYRSIYMRDVNNYIAIGTDGKVKRKGVFNQGGLLSGPQGKHPDKDICADAVVAYLKDGLPIEHTIRACTDIRKFLQVRNCRAGAIDLPTGVAISDGRYLGKALRWYYSGRPGYIGVKETGDKVAGSEGATPIMQLPTSLPLDIDYNRYITVARNMLTDLGVPQ